MTHETKLVLQYVEEDAHLRLDIAKLVAYLSDLGECQAARPAVAALIKLHFETQFRPVLGLGGDLIQAGLSQVNWMELAEELLV